MSTLVVTNRYPAVPNNGYDLRVVRLCEHVRGPRHLVVVPTGDSDPSPPTLDLGTVFDSVVSLPLPNAASASLRRHFRRNEADYFRLAFPVAFGAAVRCIRECCSALAIQRTIAFGSNLSGLIASADCPRVLFDVCDSAVLTQRRNYQHERDRLSMRQRLAARRQLRRWERCEGALPDRFSQVTTINGADTAEIVRLHGGAPRNVNTIPNGVGEAFLAPLHDRPLERSVAFWGNLDFTPNREAIRYLIQSIYRPHLEKAGVKVRIIGSGAERWLLELATADAQIEVRGFVDDLIGAVSDCAVMVNPMLIGSGLKNKVLEAFGLGLAVVSTRLGAEAFPDAVDEQHMLLADDPRAFADSVLRLLDRDDERRRLRANAKHLVENRYRWESIGARWNALLQAC